MPRFLVLSAALLLCSFAHAQSCETVVPELEAALDAAHAARDASPAEAKKVVDEWAPKITVRLAGLQPIEEGWFHLGWDVARELKRLDRKDEAERILRAIVRLDGGGKWGQKAAEVLE